MRLFIDIKTEEQLKKTMETGISCDLILPVSRAEVWRRQFCSRFEGRVFISLPEILRENKSKDITGLFAGPEIRDFSGVVIRNLDELGMIIQNGYDGTVIADSFLYAYNSMAASLYNKLISDMMTVLPEELSDEELNALGRKYPDHSELIYRVYGRQRLMVTAQETPLNSFGNSKGDRFISEWDPENEYTLVYNQAPTSMLDKACELSWKNYLAELTTESGKELEITLKAIKAFSEGQNASIKGTVRGYHYKSVE